MSDEVHAGEVIGEPALAYLVAGLGFEPIDEIDDIVEPAASAGADAETLTMVDIATGWTECLPLVPRDGSLVVAGDDAGAEFVPMGRPVVPTSTTTVHS